MLKLKLKLLTILAIMLQSIPRRSTMRETAANGIRSIPSPWRNSVSCCLTRSYLLSVSISYSASLWKMDVLSWCLHRWLKLNTTKRGQIVQKKVSDILPKTEILAQLAEEASELAQAALKLRRALDGTNPTPKSVEECLENIQEEMADVFVCLTMFGKSAERDGILIYNRYMEKIIKIENEKEARWISRLEAKEQSDE
nr:MAG TPA: pyrophosphatase [Caudoviricetes sp.]